MDAFAPFRDRESAQGWRVGALYDSTQAGKLAVRVDLLRLVLAWPACGAEWQTPTAPLPETEGDCWRWAWEGCTVDPDNPATMGAVCDATGLVYEDARRLMRMAVASRLIYPDGTIARAAQDLGERLYSQLLQPQGLQ